MSHENFSLRGYDEVLTQGLVYCLGEAGAKMTSDEYRVVVELKLDGEDDGSYLFAMQFGGDGYKEHFDQTVAALTAKLRGLDEGGLLEDGMSGCRGLAERFTVTHKSSQVCWNGVFRAICTGLSPADNLKLASAMMDIVRVTLVNCHEDGYMVATYRPDLQGILQPETIASLKNDSSESWAKRLGATIIGKARPVKPNFAAVTA